MNKSAIIIALIIFTACASQKGGTAKVKSGDSRTIAVEFLDDNTYRLTEATDDKSYGYSQSNPIKVGGTNEDSGPKNERRFLNALLGPHGEGIKYSRAGSCCPFKTPNGFINDTGMLDRYMVTWTGASDTLNIYINMYDKGDLKIPVGLTARITN
jgi:hypothetical protein